MVPREILRSRRFLVGAGLAALGALLLALLLAIGCPGEKEHLRQRVKHLEQEKKTAQTSAARWKAESKAKDQYLVSVTTLLNDVGNRLDRIQQGQKGLATLVVQGSGDSRRIVKNRALPQALDKIDEQLQKNREQIGQLETLATAKSVENQGLKAIVERFKKQNKVLDQQLQAIRRSVGVLSKKVKTLETQVVTLESEIDEKEKVIEEKETVLTEQQLKLEASEAERWAGYFVVGTRKDLCNRSILTVCRSLKFMRKPQLSQRLADSLHEFETVDVRTYKEIPLGTTKEVKLLPERPVGSFAVEERDGGSYLVILDPDQVWKFRYLVVMVER